MLQKVFGEELWYQGLIAGFETTPVWLFILFYFIIILAAYLFGSLNTAIVISRFFYHEDIRTKGSGNAGMTNMMRTYGKGPAFATFFGDILKTFLGLVVGTVLCGINGAYVAGLFSILGHVAPIYYRFKGGKGVAASAMFVLYVNPLAFLVLLSIFVLLVWALKFLSLGSIVSALVYPLLLYRMEDYFFDRPLRIIISLIAALIVVYMHRSNMKRLLEGTESKFSFKKTKKRPTADNGEKQDGEAVDCAKEEADGDIHKKSK